MMILSFAVSAIFIGLSVLHFYWAFGGRAMLDHAIPAVGGKKLFLPRRLVTAVIAIALLLCALLSLSLSRTLIWDVKTPVLTYAGYMLALLLMLRGVGDFRFVGFFKTVKDSEFARLDTALYSPLCVLVAVSVFWITSCG